MGNRKAFKLMENQDGLPPQIGGSEIKGGIPGRLTIRADREGLHIFLFYVPKPLESNIRAYSDDGNLLWIAEASWIGLDENRRIDPYVAMGWDSKEEKLFVRDFSGSYFDLNLATGAVKFLSSTR